MSDSILFIVQLASGAALLLGAVLMLIWLVRRWRNL